MSEHDDLDPQLRDLASWLDSAAAPVRLDEAKEAGSSTTAADQRGSVAAAIAIANDGPDVLLLAPAAARDGSTWTRTTSPRILVAAAVLVAVALVSGVLAITRGGNQPTDVATDLTTVPPGSPSDLTQGWERIDAALPEGMTAWAVGSNDDGLIAATSEDASCQSTSPPQCDHLRLEAWTSPDGSEWSRSGTIAEPIEAPATSRTTIEWIGDRWVLAGSVAGDPLLWTSADGASWETTPVDADGTSVAMTGLALVDGGAVAVGNTDGQLPIGGVPPVDTVHTPLVWRSSDPSGLVWDDTTSTMEALPVSAGSNNDLVYGVLAQGTTLVAYGVAVPFEGSEATTVPDVVPAESNAMPAVWVSLDSGATWIQFAMDQGMGRILSGVETADGFLLSGTLDGRAAMWTVDPWGAINPVSSPTLTTAMPASAAAELAAGHDPGVPWSLASGPNGLVAVDHAGQRLMVATDGVDWQAVDQPSLLPADTMLSNVTALGAGFVAFGAVDHIPAVWRWAPQG